VAKTFCHFHVVPSELFWQINQKILGENHSRPAWVISTFVNCLPSIRHISLQYFPVGSSELSFHCKAWGGLFAYEMCSTCSTPWNFEKPQSPHFAAFPKFFKSTGLCGSFHSWKVSDMSRSYQSNMTNHDVVSRHAAHHLQYVSWFDVSNSNDCRQENAAKPAVHCTETRRGSCAKVCSSCVQRTVSNLLPKLLKGKRCMHFGVCCVAPFNVATVFEKFVCMPYGCV